MPCVTFSVARKPGDGGPPPLRSDEFPMGLPHLRSRNLFKLHEGNQLLHFTCDLIALCQQNNVPWCFENPASSRCWMTPRVQSLGGRYIELDFCQFGEPWRKRTGLLHGGVDFSQLARLCSGQKGWCSTTGRKHQHLSGTNEHGAFWTRVAQPYPLALVTMLAQSLSEQLHF